MKTRSKDINIFSMSALDLFASALGAFILVSVVLFPYFPNTGDSPERVAEVRAALEAELALEREAHEATKQALARCESDENACGQALARCESDENVCGQALARCESDKNACESELRSVRFPHLDIVIALDVSGSMGEEMRGLRNEIDELAYVLLKLAPSLGIGVIAFGDRYWERPLFSLDIRQIQATSDVEAVKRFTARFTLNMGVGGGGNPDNPEAINLALNEAVDMRWRSQAEKKVIVIVTDNPVYPEEETNTLAMARRFASRDANNNVSTVYAETGSSESNTQAFLNALADAGRGEYVEGGVSMTASILRSLL